MEPEAVAKQLLAGQHLISGIRDEDSPSCPGITIWYNDGTSYFKKFNSAKEKELVWKSLLENRSGHFVQFGDMLFAPNDVKKVELFSTEDFQAKLVVSLANHETNHEIIFLSGMYELFFPACIELYRLLMEYQEQRSNIYFHRFAKQ